MESFKLLLCLAVVQLIPVCTSGEPPCDDTVALPWHEDHRSSPFQYVGLGRHQNAAYGVVLRYPPAYSTVCRNGVKQTHTDFVTYYVKPISVTVKFSAQSSLQPVVKEREEKLLSFWRILSMEASNRNGMEEFWNNLYSAFGNSQRIHFSPQLYFDTGLDNAVRFGKTLISDLHKHGFAPGNESPYNPKDLVEALATEIGYYVEMVCVYDKEKNRHYLYAINLCFTDTHQLLNCYLDYENKLHYCSEANQQVYIVLP